MCTNAESGRPSFDPLSEAYSLENIFHSTGDFTNVADRVAREALTWYAEWGQNKPDPVIFFRYEKSPDGWVANGQRMRDLFSSNKTGGDRKNRFVQAEAGMQPDGQAIVISEDLGEGWNKGYIYIYTDRGDHIEGAAIEHRGSEESLMKVRAALSGRALNKETNGDKADFNQPLFFQEHIRPSDVFFAVERSYNTSERVNQQPYLTRLRKAVDNYPLLQTQYERNVAELAKRAEEQFLQSDVGVKLFSDVAQTLVRSLGENGDRNGMRVDIEATDIEHEHVMGLTRVSFADDLFPEFRELQFREYRVSPDVKALDNQLKPIVMDIPGKEARKNTDKQVHNDSITRGESGQQGYPSLAHHEPLIEAENTVVHSARIVAKDSVVGAVMIREFVIKKLQERRKRTHEAPLMSERQATGKPSKETFSRPFEKKLTVFASTVVLPASAAMRSVTERIITKMEKKRKHRKAAVLSKETGVVFFDKQSKPRKERKAKRMAAIKEFFSIREKRKVKKIVSFIKKEKNSVKTRVEHVWNMLITLAKRMERQKKTISTEIRKFERKKRFGIEKKQENRKISGKTELLVTCKEQRKELMARFSFAWVLWLLFGMSDQKNHLELKQTEILQGDGSDEQIGKALVKQEFTPWILFSIIWYLAMLREQGFMQVSSQQQTRHQKKKSTIFCQQGVIFAFR